MLARLRGDLAWRLFRDGYDALPEERRRRGGADVFVSRLLGRRTVVVRGEAGARLFYDEEVVARSGAVPRPLGSLLFGRGAVHGLDGEAHRDRKALFLELLGPERTDPLVADVGARLEKRITGWETSTSVFDELVEVYGGAVLSWAGIRLEHGDAQKTSRYLAEVVDGFGFAGASYLRAWRSRIRLNRWATRLVRATRDGSVRAPADRPLAIVAASGLDDRTAAVELINILRPTVAVAWPATMAAALLMVRPDRVELVTEQVLSSFTHECRRTQPFVPALTGLARRDVRLGGEEIRRGDRILLDVVGTNTDPHTWAVRPGGRTGATDFRPRRFVHAVPPPYAFVPQGGGDPTTGHRCAGEPLTVQLIATTLAHLARHDLGPVAAGRLDLARIPTLPDPPLHLVRDSSGPAPIVERPADTATTATGTSARR